MLLHTVEAQRTRSAAQSVGLIDTDSVELGDSEETLTKDTPNSTRGVYFLVLWVPPASEGDKEQMSKMVTNEARINTKTVMQA